MSVKRKLQVVWAECAPWLTFWARPCASCTVRTKKIGRTPTCSADSSIPIRYTHRAVWTFPKIILRKNLNNLKNEGGDKTFRRERPESGAGHVRLLRRTHQTAVGWTRFRHQEDDPSDFRRFRISTRIMKCSASKPFLFKFQIGEPLK